MAAKASLPVLRVTGVRLERETVILRDIDWTVLPGQHWVMLGANGSGKTSLLNALTGYLMPSAGEIEIGRQRYGASDWREVRRAVGLVSASLLRHIEPEQTALQQVLSGADAQINYWQRPGLTLRRRAERILEQVQAGHLAGRPWLYLSQGERQRVLIGRALMARRDLLFLDEPCAGLDPVAREDFLAFLERLARTPRAPTLVLVTHHVEEIMPAFSHVLLLREGRVLASGLRDDLMTSRALTATFGAPVRIQAESGRYRLRIGRHARLFPGDGGA